MQKFSCVALASTASLLMCPVWAEPSIEEQTVDEMVVVASRLPTEPYKIGRAVSVLDEVDIENLGYRYAADLFRFIPGVAVSRSGGYGGATQLRIRGAEANHSVVLIDGVDVSAAGSGEFDMASLLSADIARIEVLRGPQSGLYGSNALGGVISITTQRPDAGFALATELEMGGNDNRQAAVSVSGGSARTQGRLTYVVRKSEFDISTDDSQIGPEDDQDDNRTLSGQLSMVLADSFSVQSFGRFTRKDTDVDGFDFSGGQAQGLAVDTNDFSNTEDLSLGVVANLSMADGRFLSKLALAHTASELDGGTFGSESDRDQVRADATWYWAEQASVTQHTTFFAQYEEESFRNLFPSDPSQVATQSRDLFGYGIEHRIALHENLFVNAVLRQDDNDDFEDATTYSFDVSYRWPGTATRLHASYGAAVTNPTFFEQFGFVPGSFVGNPDLKPEQSKGWDAGFEQAFLDGDLVVDATYFDANLDNEIQDSFPSVVNGNGTSERQGVELSLNWQPVEATSIVANYTYTDADEPGGEEVRRPAHMASLSVVHRLLDGRVRVSGGAVFNGEMLDSDFRNFFTNGFVAERTELDSYTLVNLNANYAVSDGLEVYLRVENLFDENYAETISYATPGRVMFAGVRYNFKP